MVINELNVLLVTVCYLGLAVTPGLLAGRKWPKPVPRRFFLCRQEISALRRGNCKSLQAQLEVPKR